MSLINAADARKKVNEMQTTALAKSRDECFDKINSAIQKGNSYVILWECDGRIAEELKKLGYIVSIFPGCQWEPGYVRISW